MLPPAAHTPRLTGDTMDDGNTYKIAVHGWLQLLIHLVEHHTMSGDTCPHYTRYEVSKVSSYFVDPRNKRTNKYLVQSLVPPMCVPLPWLRKNAQKYASSLYQNVTRSFNNILASQNMQALVLRTSH